MPLQANSRMNLFTWNTQRIVVGRKKTEINPDYLWKIIPGSVIIYPVHLCRDAAFSGRLSHDTFFYSVGLAVISWRSRWTAFVWRRQTEMIKPIVRDIMFLGRKSEPATADDRQEKDRTISEYWSEVFWYFLQKTEIEIFGFWCIFFIILYW